MGKIKVTQCGDIEGLKVIEPTVFGDSRGYFMETYNYNDFKPALMWNLFRTTSPAPVTVSSADFISRSTIRRINWYVW